jgi:AraC-like DNA-binding protein
MEFALEMANRIYYQSEQLEISSAVTRTEHYPAHFHTNQFQLELVVNGATECGIGRRRYAVPQTYFSVVNPAVEHYNITPHWKHALFIIFPHHTLDETAWQSYRLLSRPVAFSDVVAPCTTDLTAIVHLLFAEAVHPDRPGQRLLFDITLVQLSVALLRALHGNHSGRAVAASDATAAQTQIARAVDLIHSAFQTDLSLDDLAHAAAMSRYHFLRCFKTHVGSTPYAYLHQVRLQHAAALLRSSSRPITHIALDCGFTSPSRFSNAFRRRYGDTPSAYRHAH